MLTESILTQARKNSLRWAVALAGLAVAAGLFHPIWNHRKIGDRRPHEQITVTSLVVALRQYESAYGALPSGNSAEVCAVLMGRNQRRIVFFDPSPNSLNASNELVDHWGMPYRMDTSEPFHPRAWSCGPNGRDDGGFPGSDDVASGG